MRGASISCTGSASRRLRASRRGLFWQIVCHVAAPAGSNRSGGGGNEAAGAFETTGDSSRSASGQAITRVNVEQASKRRDVGADPAVTRGRPMSLGRGKRVE